MNILSNVAVQWLVRRIPEFAGIIVTMVTFYNSIPPQYQGIVLAVLTGQGGGLTISALIGFALWAWAQVASYRATVRPQVVQSVDGTLVTTPLKEATAIERGQVAASVPAPRKRNLLEILMGK